MNERAYGEAIIRLLSILKKVVVIMTDTVQDIELTPEIILGFDWTSRDDVNIILRVIPVNLRDAPELDNIVYSEGTHSAYPYQGGRVGNNALFCYDFSDSPDPLMEFVKVQFGGIPNTLSRLLCAFTIENRDRTAATFKTLKTFTFACANPKSGADNRPFESEQRLCLADIGQTLSNSNCCIPVEFVHSGDKWVLNTVDNGVERYAGILKAAGIEIEEEHNEVDEGDDKPEAEPISLIPGQKMELPEKTAKMTVKLNCVASFTPDLSAFILDGQTRPKAIAEQLIFYGQPSGASGAVTYDISSNSLSFDLNKIPQDIIRVVLVLSIDESGKTFGQAASLTATFIAGRQTYVYQPVLKDSQATAVEMCAVYRYKGKWKIDARGTGTNGGLAKLCAEYGVEVE